METPAASSEGLRNELQSDAEKMAGLAKDRLQSEMTEHKGEAVDQAKSLSSALGSTAESLGSDTPAWLKTALQQGARSVQQLAESVDRMDSGQLTRNVQRLARDNPGTFLAGCALAGFAAARIFQAGIPAAGKAEARTDDPSPLSKAGSDRPAMAFQGGSVAGEGAALLASGAAT